MFFLSLIVACLSISQDNLEPVNSKMPSSNLVSIAKTDPLALVQMLDGADRKAIDKIVAILRGLIQDGNQELGNLVKNVEDANKKVKATQKRLQELLKLEGEALSQLKRRQRTQAIAQGRYEACEKEHDRLAPGLKKEITTLKTVLHMLNDLLDDNTPREKELLELGSTEKGKAYLKLVANVQADPDKVRKIIGWVGTLLEEASKELEALVLKKAQCKRELEVAKENTRKAQVKYKQAVDARKLCDAQLVEDIAARDAAVEILTKRRIIILNEKRTLEEVITLLQSTADKE